MEVSAVATRPGMPPRSAGRSPVSRSEEAKKVLSTYGEATLVMWPDFVPNVPTDVNRIALTIPSSEPSIDRADPDP